MKTVCDSGERDKRANYRTCWQAPSLKQLLADKNDNFVLPSHSQYAEDKDYIFGAFYEATAAGIDGYHRKVQFIRHPYRCDQFFQCAHGQAQHVVTCPGNLMFNTHLNVCDWPSNVDCDDDDAKNSNLYHLSDSYSDDFTDHRGGDNYYHSYDVSSDDDDDDMDDNDDDMSDDDDYDNNEDNYYWDDDEEGDYHHNYDYILPHHYGTRPLHVRPATMHGYLPIQWYPHPAFGLPGVYQPSAGYRTLPSGLHKPTDNFSPLLAALFNLQYHHPPRHSNYRHQQHYHYSPEFGFHKDDESYDNDEGYHMYNNHHGFDSHDDSDDDDHYDHDNRHDVYEHYKSGEDDEKYEHYMSYDDDDNRRHYMSDDNDKYENYMSEDDDDNKHENYMSSEEDSYDDSDHDQHYNNHFEKYQEKEHNHHHRHHPYHYRDYADVEEQSAWLYPYFKYPAATK
ncbi:hypothetical protein ElyMa_005357200 [Elysia marginata]|uniref:Chitin-binding type-2 domain-containing protein n=1 Tax=Elysia marginata TaxID=1093978 RepID=A0AAV4EC83_9GAST|nr:hypothetical protein ElyMa_005357200 [Elysia marginata]